MARFLRPKILRVFLNLHRTLSSLRTYLWALKEYSLQYNQSHSNCTTLGSQSSTRKWHQSGCSGVDSNIIYPPVLSSRPRKLWAQTIGTYMKMARWVETTQTICLLWKSQARLRARVSVRFPAAALCSLAFLPLPLPRWSLSLVSFRKTRGETWLKKHYEENEFARPRIRFVSGRAVGAIKGQPVMQRTPWGGRKQVK